jgi:hypothetical protein
MALNKCSNCNLTLTAEEAKAQRCPMCGAAVAPVEKREFEYQTGLPGPSACPWCLETKPDTHMAYLQVRHKAEKNTELIVASVTTTTKQTLGFHSPCCDLCFRRLKRTNATGVRIFWWILLGALGCGLFVIFTHLPKGTHEAVYIVPFVIMGVLVFLVGPWLIGAIQDQRISTYFAAHAASCLLEIRSKLREAAPKADLWSITMRVSREPFEEPSEPLFRP